MKAPKKLYRRVASVTLVCLVACLPACSTIAGPYTPQREAARDPQKAQELNARAAELIGSDQEKAERLLREALAADLYHGPAHNNLGVIYLERGLLYEAAGEFEWARKLLPGHPDPRLNLAVALERAGKIDQALDTYATALEVYPGHLPTLQAITRCQLRHDRVDEQTAAHLDEIAYRSADPAWRAWARSQQSQIDR